MRTAIIILLLLALAATAPAQVFPAEKLAISAESKSSLVEEAGGKGAGHRSFRSVPRATGSWAP